MAYVEVNHEFLEKLKSDLAKGSAEVFNYIKARDEWYKFQDDYKAAHAKFEKARRDTADHLLNLMGDIDRVEYHKKGEAW